MKKIFGIVAAVSMFAVLLTACGQKGNLQTDNVAVTQDTSSSERIPEEGKIIIESVIFSYDADTDVTTASITCKNNFGKPITELDIFVEEYDKNGVLPLNKHVTYAQRQEGVLQNGERYTFTNKYLGRITFLEIQSIEFRDENGILYMISCDGLYTFNYIASGEATLAETWKYPVRGSEKPYAADRIPGEKPIIIGEVFMEYNPIADRTRITVEYQNNFGDDICGLLTSVSCYDEAGNLLGYGYTKEDGERMGILKNGESCFISYMYPGLIYSAKVGGDIGGCYSIYFNNKAGRTLSVEGPVCECVFPEYSLYVGK